MKKKLSRSRPKQINILHTNTYSRPSRRNVTQLSFWTAVIMAMVLAVGFVLHLGISLLLDHALYHNDHYALQKIEIESDHQSRYPISSSAVKQAAGLELGENLWDLQLPKIAHDLGKLAYVSSARVERHFPNRLFIHITERLPVVRITAVDAEFNRRQVFYLDRECVVLRPRDDETKLPLPEVIGLTTMDDEVEPGVRLEQPALTKALQILEAIGRISTLNTSIDIRYIDLSQPLQIRMVTTRDMVITFRLDYIDQQLARLDAIFRRFAGDPRTIHTVDLTPDRNDPVTFYE